MNPVANIFNNTVTQIKKLTYNTNNKMKMKLNKKFVTLLAAGVTASSASAMTVAIGGDTSDAEATATGGVGAINNNTILAGSYYGAGPGVAAVFAFQLPTLVAGESFSAASLDLNLTGISGTPTFNGDLVGIRSNSSNAVLGSDYSGGTLLHDDYVTTASTAGSQVSDDFAAWLNTQTAGEFVFIRVEADIDVSGGVGSFTGYNFTTANSGTPTLNVTIVPEPSSTALLGLGGLALILRRRK